MELDRRARLTGAAGLAATLLWLANWTYLLFVDPATGTAAWYVAELLAVPALLGTAVLAAGLWAVRAGGPGRFARASLGAWTLAWLLIFAGGVVLLVTKNEDNPLFPAGGILGTFAGLAAGIMIARAGVLDGWRRWAPLALAVWHGVVLGAIMNVAGDGWVATTAELVAYLLIGLTAAGLTTARLTYRVPTAASPVTA